MFYKYIEEFEEWHSGNKISFPDGTTLSVDNKGQKDGWFWSDEPPIEYTEWLQTQQNN